ncbi:UbiA prenyltransferase family-domain-containing protein [Daldinia caldariorum]|uniref:UbiA prenyltransferase family-domain-containing protein n=1 Tax=Daldinia caldariorum TaxID=326644 RepID=UPI00200804C4|nr:UbiA prenyltransferase family-domain-containing protein [Daldinia caldariorum]KAI1464445.1 UbiA prenyltransferase family-domain-containing protein [Daldinia caldariorum]
MFLFTKSDFKTVIIPQSIFAISTATSLTRSTTKNSQEGMAQILSRSPYMLGWLWLHLLVENIANQRLASSVQEDRLNKPWRPLPAGRITTSEAQAILRVLVPTSVVVSLLIGGLLPSVTLMTFIWLYNDLDGSDAGPWQRNMINAGGLACFGWGAVSILLGGPQQVGDQQEKLCRWLVLTSVIITTTVFAQDFPDIDGDKIRHRNTLPLLYAETYSRALLAIFILFWSLVSPIFWNVRGTAWSVSVSIGSVMAFLTLFGKSKAIDEAVWKLWCVWITTIYLLPILSV